MSWWQSFLWGLGPFRREVASIMSKGLVGSKERQAETLKNFEKAMEKAAHATFWSLLTDILDIAYIAYNSYNHYCM